MRVKHTSDLEKIEMSHVVQYCSRCHHWPSSDNMMHTKRMCVRVCVYLARLLPWARYVSYRRLKWYRSQWQCAFHNSQLTSNFIANTFRAKWTLGTHKRTHAMKASASVSRRRKTRPNHICKVWMLNNGRYYFPNSIQFEIRVQLLQRTYERACINTFDA